MSISNEKSFSEHNFKNHRIHHFKIRGEWTLHHYIESFLQLSIEKVNQLLLLGAIYLNGKRIHENTQLTPDDYLRVHAEPRRFLVPKNISELILFEDDFFIALNKPQGTPCHPTLDNRYENLLNILRLDRNQEYFLCHRLDIGTEGVLLFAKTKEVQTYMMQHWKEVTKIYHTRTHGPNLESQVLRHWMRPHPRAPKILAGRPVENWQLCELRILKSKVITYHENPQIHFHNQQINGAAEQPHKKVLPERSDTNIYSEILQFNEYEIELMTGRTHQIRAQLSFEQNPILGDTLYGSSYRFEQQNGDRFALKCTQISFCFFDKDYQLISPPKLN
jgi:23S rRNA pseudouridine1911/1915/1917 synthase